MQVYQNLLRHILMSGEKKHDRTGVGIVSVFGYDMRFDLSKGFPMVTTKKLHLRSIIHELLWMLKGDTNIDYLHQHKVTIWDEWANDNGDLGPIYGKQWRAWEGPNGEVIDQLSNILNEIKQNPDSRRLVVNSWNVADLPKMALSPCHMSFQFYVSNNRLSCKLTQRSADVFLGVPFNIASYALLTHMVAEQCHLQVGDFIWSGGDCHIYLNHMEAVKTLLSRDPLPLPQLKLAKRDSLFDYQYEDIDIINYQSHPAIKAEVAV